MVSVGIASLTSLALAASEDELCRCNGGNRGGGGASLRAMHSPQRQLTLSKMPLRTASRKYEAA